MYTFFKHIYCPTFYLMNGGEDQSTLYFAKHTERQFLVAPDVVKLVFNHIVTYPTPINLNYL